MGGEDHKCIEEVWRKYWPKTQDGDYGGDDAEGHQGRFNEAFLYADFAEI